MTDITLNKAQTSFVNTGNKILDEASTAIEDARSSKSEAQAKFMRHCAAGGQKMSAENFEGACNSFENKTRRSLSKSYGHPRVAPLMDSILTIAQGEIATRNAADDSNKAMFLQDASFVNIANKIVTRIKSDNDKYSSITTPDGAVQSLRSDAAVKRNVASTPDGIKAKLKKPFAAADVKLTFSEASINAVCAAVDALEVKPADEQAAETSESDVPNVAEFLAEAGDASPDDALTALLQGAGFSPQQAAVVAALTA